MKFRATLGVPLLLLLAACGNKQPTSGVLPAAVVAERIASAHLYRQITGPPATIDPALSLDVMGLAVLSDLFEGLVRQDPAGNVVPGVAERWEVSADGLTWTFHLRGNAVWSNGDPVTAQDFVFAWRRVVDPATASTQAQQLETIVGATEISARKAAPETLGVTALDVRTLQVRLAKPTPYFLALLMNAYLFPVHAPTVTGAGQAWLQPDRIVSNGAFLLKSREISGGIELVRNPRYWDAAAVKLQAVSYVPLTDPSTATARFLAGNLDITDRFQIDDLKWLRASLGDEVRVSPYFGTVFLGMHTQRPPFDNLALRQAMSLAIDREVLTNQLLKGLFLPAYGIVSPLPGYTSPQPAWARLDAAARHALARQLYAQAGYSAGHPLEVEFTFPTGNQEMRQVFEAMAAMWRTNLGANVQLVSEEFRVHQQNRRIGKLRLFWFAWIADYPDPMTFLWLALRANPQNYGRFDNADYERVMAQAIATVDAGERNRGYNEAERILDAQMPFIPIYYYKSRHLLRSYVQGWQDAATDQHPSRDLYLAARPDP